MYPRLPCIHIYSCTMFFSLDFLTFENIRKNFESNWEKKYGNRVRNRVRNRTIGPDIFSIFWKYKVNFKITKFSLNKLVSDWHVRQIESAAKISWCFSLGLRQLEISMGWWMEKCKINHLVNCFGRTLIGKRLKNRFSVVLLLKSNRIFYFEFMLNSWYWLYSIIVPNALKDSLMNVEILL